MNEVKFYETTSEYYHSLGENIDPLTFYKTENGLYLGTYQLNKGGESEIMLFSIPAYSDSTTGWSIPNDNVYEYTTILNNCPWYEDADAAIPELFIQYASNFDAAQIDDYMTAFSCLHRVEVSQGTGEGQVNVIIDCYGSYPELDLEVGLKRS